MSFGEQQESIMKEAVRDLPLQELDPKLNGQLEIEDDSSREAQPETAFGYVLQLSKEIFLNGTDVTLDNSKAFVRACADFFQVFALKQRDKASNRLKAIEDAIIQKVDALIMKAAGENTTIDRLSHTDTVRVNGRKLEYTEMPKVVEKVIEQPPRNESTVNVTPKNVQRDGGQSFAERQAELDAVIVGGPFDGMTFRQERNLTVDDRTKLIETPLVPRVAQERFLIGRYRRVKNFDASLMTSKDLTEDELNATENRTKFYSDILSWAKSFDERKWQAELVRLSGDTKKAEQMMEKLSQERADYLASLAKKQQIFDLNEAPKDALVGHASTPTYLKSRSLYPELHARVAELFVQEAEEEALSERIAKQQKEQQEKDDKQKLQDERDALRKEQADKSWGKTSSSADKKDQE